jgi:hypothetical protein
MGELAGVCQACRQRLILGDPDKIGVEMEAGVELRASVLPDVMAGLRGWLEARSCPSCGGQLRAREG